MKCSQIGLKCVIQAGTVQIGLKSDTDRAALVLGDLHRVAFAPNSAAVGRDAADPVPDRPWLSWVPRAGARSPIVGLTDGEHTLKTNGAKRPLAERVADH